jgi:hypothetical protein
VNAFNDQRNIPDSIGVNVSGFINGQAFNCYKYGSNVANVVVARTLSEGSIQVDTSQLSCDGASLPSAITMHCIANGKHPESFVGNGSSTDAGFKKSIHHQNVNLSSADCTATADEVILDSSEEGNLSHSQYVQ